MEMISELLNNLPLSSAALNNCLALFLDYTHPSIAKSSVAIYPEVGLLGELLKTTCIYTLYNNHNRKTIEVGNCHSLSLP
jgi:hypothetical protein